MEGNNFFPTAGVNWSMQAAGVVANPAAAVAAPGSPAVITVNWTVTAPDTSAEVRLAATGSGPDDLWLAIAAVLLAAGFMSVYGSKRRRVRERRGL